MKLKILTYLRNFYKYIPQILKIYVIKGTMQRKLRSLKKIPFLWKFKRVPSQSQKYRNNCRRFWLSSSRKLNWNCEKKKKTVKGRQIIVILQGAGNNDIDKITSKHSIWKPGWSGGANQKQTFIIFLEDGWINLVHVKLKFVRCQTQTLLIVFRQYFHHITGVTDCWEINSPSKNQKTKSKNIVITRNIGCILFISKTWGWSN